MTNTKGIALVTGGSRGLGHNMAINIAKEGLDVIITYNNKKEEADKVVAEITATGVKAIALQLNTADIKSFDEFVGTVTSALKETFGADKINYLVNNAGIGIPGSVAETTEENFDAIMNVNFKGVFFLTQKLLPLIADGGGIINLSSGLARTTNPMYSVYASLKGAIEVLTRYEAKEFGARGIRSNVVAPGAIETDFGGGFVRDNKEVNKTIAAATALGRVGLPDDIGPVVAFLCTEEARWINAQRIEVSGGQMI